MNKNMVMIGKDIATTSIGVMAGMVFFKGVEAAVNMAALAITKRRGGK